MSNSMLRRQCLSCLDEARRWITKHEAAPRGANLGARVREVLLMCMMSTPLLTRDMRGHLDGRPVAADASERGGGVSVGVELTRDGVVTALMRSSVHAALHERGVVVVELFGGIGGLGTSVGRSGIHVCCAGHAESDKEARDVYRRNWADLAGRSSRT